MVCSHVCISSYTSKCITLKQQSYSACGYATACGSLVNLECRACLPLIPPQPARFTLMVEANSSCTAMQAMNGVLLWKGVGQINLTGKFPVSHNQPALCSHVSIASYISVSLLNNRTVLVDMLHKWCSMWFACAFWVKSPLTSDTTAASYSDGEGHTL